MKDSLYYPILWYEEIDHMSCFSSSAKKVIIHLKTWTLNVFLA